MKVFIDLEETLIVDWSDRRIIPKNINKIKSFLTKNNIKEVTLFSLAVRRIREKDIFERELAEWLEQWLEAKIIITEFDKDFLEPVLKKHNIKMQLGDSLLDIFPINPKRDIFCEWCFMQENETEFILFDDMIDDCIIKCNNKIITLIKMRGEEQ